MFTGLNNLKIVSVLDESYAEYFGFTQNEVDSFLESYGIIQKKDEVKSWYDGYINVTPMHFTDYKQQQSLPLFSANPPVYVLQRQTSPQTEKVQDRFPALTYH